MVDWRFRESNCGFINKYDQKISKKSKNAKILKKSSIFWNFTFYVFALTNKKNKRSSQKTESYDLKRRVQNCCKDTDSTNTREANKNQSND
ncbi:hypothetical protein BpHYR1_012086 [Brachionus plicatilis]|uniref:Uncharacterized protein n=1 Tax=Brachionus plicatilis TaxID=10195 RepID=A0A3M7SS00_BRAPC|nr:hypothetical protein BpHYR1_012086 [Brachionus plicatilis]